MKNKNILLNVSSTYDPNLDSKNETSVEKSDRDTFFRNKLMENNNNNRRLVVSGSNGGSSLRESTWATSSTKKSKKSSSSLSRNGAADGSDVGMMMSEIGVRDNTIILNRIAVFFIVFVFYSVIYLSVYLVCFIPTPYSIGTSVRSAFNFTNHLLLLTFR